MDYNILKTTQVKIETKKELVDLLAELKTFTSTIRIFPFSVLNYDSIEKAKLLQSEE